MKIKFAVLFLAVLVIYGQVMVRRLLATEDPPVEPPKPPEPKSRIVVTKDLQAFTLLTDGNLESRTGSAPVGQIPTIKDFSERYLLVNLRKGGEVKEENVAPPGAKDLLSDAVTVSIPATPTLLGGQLRVRDLFDLVAVPTKGGTPEKFENLMVLNIIQANKDTNLPNAIVLAVPRTELNRFASAVVGAELLVTRKIVAIKP